MIEDEKELESDSNPVQSEDEELNDSELNGTDSTPSQGDPTANCPICQWESKKASSRSMKAHIRHYVEVEEDPAHIDGKDEAYALIDDWREAHKPVKKPAKTRKSRVSSGSGAVRLKSVETEFDPAEEDEVIRLKKEIERLKLQNQRDNLYDGSNRKDHDDRRDKDDNQIIGILRDTLRQSQGSGKDDKSYEDMKFWREMAMQNSVDYKKSLESQNKELVGEIKELRSDVEVLTEQSNKPLLGVSAGQMPGLDKLAGELAIAVKQGVRHNTSVAMHGQTIQAGTPPEEQPDITVTPTGDDGILSHLPSHIVKEDDVR